MGFNAGSYRKLLQSLLPQGRAWSRAPSAVLTELLTGNAQELVKVDTQVSSLIQERDTRLSTLLLEEHELDLGLPDDCSNNIAKSIPQRRQDANAKLLEVGELSKVFFINIALVLGYTITIDEFIPFWCGVGASGESCGDQKNIFYWRINIDSDIPIIYFKSGAGRSGDPLTASAIGDDLVCILDKFKPAHTIVTWQYTGPSFSVGFDSSFNSLLSSEQSYLEGSFSKAFSGAFDVNTGGSFDFNNFGVGFNKSV